MNRNLTVAQMKGKQNVDSPAKVGPAYHGRNTQEFYNYGANAPIGFSSTEKVVFIALAFIGIVAYAVYHFHFKV